MTLPLHYRYIAVTLPLRRSTKPGAAPGAGGGCGPHQAWCSSSGEGSHVAQPLPLQWKWERPPSEHTRAGGRARALAVALPLHCRYIAVTLPLQAAGLCPRGVFSSGTVTLPLQYRYSTVTLQLHGRYITRRLLKRRSSPASRQTSALPFSLSRRLRHKYRRHTPTVSPAGSDHLLLRTYAPRSPTRSVPPTRTH